MILTQKEQGQLTEKQIYARWAQLNEKKWRMDDDQVLSATKLLQDTKSRLFRPYVKMESMQLHLPLKVFLKISEVTLLRWPLLQFSFFLRFTERFVSLCCFFICRTDTRVKYGFTLCFTFCFICRFIVVSSLFHYHFIHRFDYLYV